MRNIVVILVAIAMLTATTANAQYNDEISGSASFYAGQKNLDILKKELKIINDQITAVEKKMAKELKEVNASEAKAPKTVVVANSAYQGEDADTVASGTDPKWEEMRNKIRSKYEDELKSLKSKRDEKLSQISNESNLFYSAGKTSTQSATNAINSVKGGPATASTEYTGAPAATTMYTGVIENPLWVDVNIIISGPNGKTGVYIRKGSSLEIELPAGKYQAWRENGNGYMVGNSTTFHVIPGVLHNYAGRKVPFFLVVSK